MKILATNFSPLFLLHCHNQVAKTVTLFFRLFCLLQKMPALDGNFKYSCENCGTLVTKKNLSDTNRVAVVEHCIVINVPISLLNQEMI